MNASWHDLRYAFRTLRKNPGFVTVAVLSLALGIGANTAIFSLIDAVMLRALPVAHPETLVLLTEPGTSGIAVDSTETGVRSLLAYPEFDRLRAQNDVFSGMAAIQSDAAALDIRMDMPNAEYQAKARCQLVTGEFFALLGLEAALGRLFTPEEDRLNADPVAVLSHGYWRRQFAGDPSVMGKTVHVGRALLRIIGVAPPGFRGISVGSEAEIWIPMAMQERILPGRSYLNARDTLWLQVMARLRNGVSRQVAQAGINVTFQQILRDWVGYARNEKERRELLDQRLELREGAKGASVVRAQFSDALLLMMGMVGLVLLIACANIANLTLARATGRRREIGIRLALGCGRARLIRQLLTESTLLALFGGLAGILFAVWGTDLLLALVSGGAGSISLDVHRDLRVLAFTACISLATGLLFGLAPALRATRVDVNETLSANTRGRSQARGGVRSGRILVVAQVALSLLLLFGATLLVRSLRNLLTQNIGYEREHLLMARVDLVARGYKGAAASAMMQQAMDKLRTIPGVRAATLSQSGLFGGDSGDRISIDGPTPRSGREMVASWDLVGAGYFSTLGIPLLRGREISADDMTRGASVCVINQSMASFFFADADPIGRHITDEYPTTRVTCEIVGVAADVRDHRLRGRQERRFYASIAHPIGTVQEATFILRTTGKPADAAAAVRRALAEVDRALPIVAMRTVTEQIDRRVVADRMMAQLSGFFGALALVMAAIGLYGVMSYSVTLRTNEIGLRMALGAGEGQVLSMVLREVLWLVAVGVAIGLPCAMAAARLLAGRLFGLSPADPSTIALAILVILAAAAFAGYLPARRAARVDPMTALRNE